jgi:SAM-dependent methyltransferase
LIFKSPAFSSSSSFDSDEFKIAQRRRWDNVAVGWKEWWETFETAAQKVSDRLVELAGIRPGQKVLDIATGIGEPAITVATNLVNGSGSRTTDIRNNVGYVLATDISTQMLTIAKQRALELELEDLIEFREGDIESLELHDSSFDSVVCRWALMFMRRLNDTLSHIWRILIRGGRFVCAVWAEASKVPFISIPLDIVISKLNVCPSPIGAPGPFLLADVSILESALSNIGFVNIHTERLNVTFEFATAEDYVNYTKAVSSTIKSILSKEPVKRQEEIWNKVREFIRNNYTGSGNSAANQPVRMHNECVCMTAKKPEQSQC